MDKRSLKQYYEQKAQTLDEYHITYDHPSLYKRFFFTTRLKNVLAMLHVKRGEHILDIGCGSGAYTRMLLKKGAFVTATDIAKTYLEQTKKLARGNKRLKCVVADATRLPSKSNSFDKVLFTEVIEHIPDYKKSLKEIKRVLKSDGIVVISTPSRFSPLNVAYNVKRKIKGYTFNEHLHEFTPREFTSLVQEYFFVEKVLFTNFFFPYPLDLLVINIRSQKFISVLYQAEKFMQKNRFLKYLGWTMVIRAKKIL